MPIYSVEFASRAEQDLRKLDITSRLRAMKAIARLAENPRPVGCKKLEGAQGAFRVRVGDLRIVYAVRDDILLVLVARVANRREVYR